MIQIDVEKALMEKHKKFEDFEKAFEEWQSKQENQTSLWTQESFAYWFDRYVVAGFKEYQKKAPSNLPYHRFR